MVPNTLGSLKPLHPVLQNARPPEPVAQGIATPTRSSPRQRAISLRPGTGTTARAPAGSPLGSEGPAVVQPRAKSFAFTRRPPQTPKATDSL